MAAGGIFMLSAVILGPSWTWVGGWVCLSIGALIMMVGAIHLTTRATAEQALQKETEPNAITAIFFAFLMPPVGLVLAILSLGRIKKNPELRGRGLAISSLVLSLASMGFLAVSFMLRQGH